MSLRFRTGALNWKLCNFAFEISYQGNSKSSVSKVRLRMLTCSDCARGGGPSSRCFGSSPSAPSKLWMEFGSKAHTQRVPEKKTQYRRECNSPYSWSLFLHSFWRYQRINRSMWQFWKKTNCGLPKLGHYQINFEAKRLLFCFFFAYFFRNIFGFRVFGFLFFWLSTKPWYGKGMAEVTRSKL